MPNLIRVTFASSLLALVAMGSSLPFHAAETSSLTIRLEKLLNMKGEHKARDLFVEDQVSSFMAQYKEFADRFLDPKWTVKKSSSLHDGRQVFNISVTGLSQFGERKYSLNSTQEIAVLLNKGKISEYEIIAEESILKTIKSNLPISVIIPHIVLTGSRYDVDVFFNDPIGDALVAGGIASLTVDDNRAYTSPDIELSPMYGGGIFKSVLAPKQPGYQKWAIILAHPDGLIAVTKRVKVISD